MIYRSVVFAFIFLLAWCKNKGFVSDIMAIQLFCIAILLEVAGIHDDIKSLKQEQRK